MTTDLEQRIRRYVETAPPITFDEIANPSQPLRQPVSKSLRPLAGIALAALLAGVGVAVDAFASGHNEHSISIVSPPATTALPNRVGPPLSDCRWTAFTSGPSVPGDITASGAPRGYWTCATTVTQAEKVLGFPLPTVQVPTGWLVASQEIRGFGVSWDYNQTWTPDGRPIPGTPSEQFVQLRIARHAAGQSTIPYNTTLSNGDPAHLFSSGGGTGIIWTHDGVDYGIGTAGLGQARALAIANALANSLS